MKVKHIILTVFLSIFTLSCSENETIEQQPTRETTVTNDEPLSEANINAIIEESLSAHGTFSWEDVDDHTLWSALVHGEKILSIGYGKKGAHFSSSPNAQLTNLKNKLLAIVTKSEGLSKENATITDYNVINVLDVQVDKLSTIKKLRNTKGVRYIEPIGYSTFSTKSSSSLFNGSGCSQEGDDIYSSDYTTTAPNNAKISWNLNLHNIPSAWRYSTGKGITVGLIDTGISKSQTLLNPSGFNDGYSYGRTVEKYGTFIDSFWWWSSNYDGPHDLCGHGTSMASIIAAPRNDNGQAIGVAYNSNLIAYRATEDVVLNDYHERKGVTKALIQLANRSDVKIISMSVGYLWSIGNIRDAIKYAHSRGKLIFAAGGTSTAYTTWYGVIFPASMSETVAITGVKDTSNYQDCETCHSGSKIDFTIIMERANNTNRHVLTLGFYNGQENYVGGSSSATATTAGIAALVWARHPTWTKNQILQKLKQSAEFYPYKSSRFGYGNIDALRAVQ
ncbi:MAG: serine protease [Flavobacteriaceae bacterium]|nr:MAG: serine protease [Flavobacteriaceae bacterium]